MPQVSPEAVSVKFLTDKAGLYLHIPFCVKKCRYCNFYSSFMSEELLNKYCDALIREIKQWGGSFNRPIDTVYFGGGTPSLLGYNLPMILDAVAGSFSLSSDSEITLEINPDGNIENFLDIAKTSGVNRISIGAESGIDEELKLLGRTHSVEDTVNAYNYARKIGFDNISLDIMIGLPDSDDNSLNKSLKFVTGLEPEHISAYILQVEKNTAFYNMRDTLDFKDDDTKANQYLKMCEVFENGGYSHYEISNFSKSGFESRHNNKYWTGAEYLGIGPSAHSMLSGKRFFYDSNLKSFINGAKPVFDGIANDKEEFIMLRLRLKKGISLKEYEASFGEELSNEFYKKCLLFEKNGLMNISSESISLTNEGMLVSNSIISELSECVL